MKKSFQHTHTRARLFHTSAKIQNKSAPKHKTFSTTSQKINVSSLPNQEAPPNDPLHSPKPPPPFSNPPPVQTHDPKALLVQDKAMNTITAILLCPLCL
mmetsp:Transcript_27772/g.41319  ORF Transcript_27772/g.41319 Transcript_27772/m.41319 type:complete len:99 (+) Transcript_27772:193-489(+)